MCNLNTILWKKKLYFTIFNRIVLDFKVFILLCKFEIIVKILSKGKLLTSHSTISVSWYRVQLIIFNI